MAPRPDAPGAHWCMRCLHSAASLAAPPFYNSAAGALKCDRCARMGLAYIMCDSRLDLEAGAVVQAHETAVSTGLAADIAVRDAAVMAFRNSRNRLCASINSTLAT
jgi:hypothetical protein